PGQVEPRDRSNEWLAGQEPHGPGDTPEMVHAIDDAMIFDTSAQPHVVRNAPARVTRRRDDLTLAAYHVTGHVGGHPPRALGEDLELVPAGALHDLEDTVNE